MMLDILNSLISETALYVTAGLLSITSIWALIELVKEKKYRWTMWIVTPIVIASIFLLVMSVTTLKGMPTSKLPEKEFFIINYVPIEGQGIYLWIVEDGAREPLSIKLPWIKETEKKLKEGSDRAKKKGRPMKGSLKPFGNEKSKDLRLWEFDVESTLPQKDPSQTRPRLRDPRPAAPQPIPEG